MHNRLRSLDRNFLHLETETTQQVIGCFCQLETEPNAAQLLERFQALVASRPRLQQRVQRGFLPHWVVDEDFSLDQHVQWHYCPNAATFDDLSQEAARLFSTPWDSTRPFWRFYLLTARDRSATPQASRACAFLFCIHHCLADGLGGLELIRDICDHEKHDSDPADRPAHRESRLRRERLRTWRRFLVLPSAAMRLCREWISFPPSSPLTGTNSPQRELSTISFAFPVLRDIAAETSASINDVVLSIISGAVRRYHVAHGSTLNKPLRAIIPVSLRPLSQHKEFGNQLTAIGFPIPLRPSDPLIRLKQVHAYGVKMKNSGAIFAYALGGKFNAILPRSLQRRVAEFQARKTHFICTNMPGPRETLTLAGVRILGKYGLAALMRNHGIAFSFISYAGQMCTSIVSDPGIITKPQLLQQFVAESFEELCAAVMPERESNVQASTGQS